jgi:glycosyltransferase involved in cell wall biosynthesis
MSTGGAGGRPAERVLAVAQSPALGGAEYALLRLAPRLAEHGFAVDITTPGPGPLEDAARAAGLTVRRLPVGDLRGGAWPGALAALPRARALVREGAYGLAWLNGTVAQRMAPALAAAALVPHVHDMLERKPLPWRSRLFWARAPIVLCDSRAVAGRAWSLGAPAAALRVVPCPVDGGQPAERPQWADGRPTVGFVGRLEPRKAPLDLLRALPLLAERIPDVRVVLVGGDELDTSGSYSAQVRAEAARHAERVLTVGEVPDATALMPWFDLLAVPSRVEPFGTVAAEALAAGTPVVATRSGGMEEYVSDTVGALVGPGDPAALAEALAGVLPRAAELGDACRAAAAPFATARVAAAVAHAFTEALAARRARDQAVGVG